jgi:hypothetical protein
MDDKPVESLRIALVADLRLVSDHVLITSPIRDFPYIRSAVAFLPVTIYP